MRIWINPEKLAAHEDWPATDVVNAVREQNALVAIGPNRPAAGSAPRPRKRSSRLPRSVDSSSQSSLRTSSFRRLADSKITRIKDIGHVVLAANSEDLTCQLDGQPSIGLIIYPIARGRLTAGRRGRHSRENG